MRALILADTQIGSGKQLADDRLADQEAVLDQVADLAHERDVDVVLHLGDVFEHRHPGEEERMVFKRFVASVMGYDRRTNGNRVIVLAGNHDLSNTALASAVDLYDRCEFIRTPTVLDLGGCSLACLPWAPIHNLVAAREQARNGAFEQAAEALVAIARDLRARCPEGKPALLAAHWAISGAQLPSGLPVDELGEVIVPDAVLYDFDVVLGGHIHHAGWFASNALYAGSPYPCGFGEAGDDHGVWIWDSQDMGRDAMDSVEFVPLASRPLVTIDVDFRIVDWAVGGDAELAEISGANDSTAILIAQLRWHNLTDATVRLRYTASEEQHHRVDQPALKRAILQAGAHRVYSVEPTILRESRARAVGVDESLEPAAALDAWCIAQQVTDMQRQGLQGLLARWSA